MKFAATNKISKILGMGFCLFLVACGGSKATQTRSTAQGQNLTQSSCAAGTIYNETLDGISPYSSRSFQDRVGDFVSATLAPSDLGSVSGDKNSKTNYISLTGKAKFDTNGQIIPAQSSLKILIYDSLVGSLNSDGEAISAYPVTIEQAVSGQYDSVQQTFTVIYQDSYGNVTLTGKVNGSSISGRIDFANTAAVDSLGPRSGALGAFSISTCAFF